MEGAAAAQSLVSNVGQLVGDEFRQLRSVGGEVARLRNELATINALLRMQSEADEGAVDHFLREWMKQLREVGYDAEDCVDFYLFRVRSRQGDRCFVRWKRLLGTLWARHRLAGDIRDLRALASAINEQHARYGFSLEPLRRRDSASSLGPAAASARPPLGPADSPYSHRHQFVGNKALAVHLANKIKALDPYLADSSLTRQQSQPQAIKIEHLGTLPRPGSSWQAGTEQALNDEDDKQPPKVFSIWGFGGLGKTTLALEVCRLLEAEFPCQAQVSVSQTFSGKDLQGLLKRLLRQISDDAASTTNQQADPLANIDTMDVGKLEDELRRRLEGKRYLILIDDIWSIPAWDMIWSKIPRSKYGSRIIVTTRMDNVAKACSGHNNDYIHQMKKLDDKDSEKLFISKAFGSAENPCPNDEDLNGAMRSILKKCGGLPLAIVSIASLLAGYKLPEGKTMWETIQKSIGTQLETNPTLEGMRQILTLSYNDLPHHLKACMMYLSIFPDDYMICKDRLLKRWIAEGLVAKKRGLTQMELAEGYFNELMSRSMIDRATDICATYERMEERCRVHDMMLEIMVSKSLEANFVSLVGGQYEGMSYTDTIRRLSVHGGVEAHKDSHSSSSKNMTVRHGMGNGIIKGVMMQHVRSLSIFDPEAGKLVDRLGEFTLLRVLDLEDCKGLEEKHMGYIYRMYLLRFLSLKGTDIKVMPPRVDDLEHLQMLDVRQTHLKDLPQTVTKLEKLEHVLFSTKGSWSGWKLPRGINKMKALRQVNRADVIHDPKVAEEIGELDQLQELAIYVNSRDPRMNPEVYEKLASSLSKTFSLRWLDVGDLSCREWPFHMTMDFLHKVESPPRLLRYLKIHGYIDRMPDWVRSLTNLAELNIAWTYLDGAQLVDFLCKLPKLKRLSLGSYFMDKEEVMVVGSNQPFPELKELNLRYASGGIPSGYRFEESCMPKLEKLVVEFGDQGKSLVGVEHLTSLKEVQYSGHRHLMKNAVEKLEEMNTNRDEYKQIAVRLTYWD